MPSSAVESASQASSPGLYQALQNIHLNTVRRALSTACFERSAGQTFGWLAFDLAAGCAVAFLFVWGHDAAHGALFRGKWTAEILGTVAMLPSLNMYRLWC